MFGVMIDTGAIPTPIHDLKVKVTDLTFMLKFLGPHCLQTLWWIWFMFGIMIDTGFKILHSTIPNPIHDLKVKVTDLELSC